MRYGWPFPHGERVEFVKRAVTGVDDLGNDVWGDEVTSVESCATWPWGADMEDDQRQAQVKDMLAVAGPIDLDIDAFSEFVAGGVRYRIEGQPERWRSPLTGSAPASLAVGKVVTG